MKTVSQCVKVHAPEHEVWVPPKESADGLTFTGGRAVFPDLEDRVAAVGTDAAIVRKLGEPDTFS